MYKIIGADQKIYGPVTAEQLRQWIAEGRAIGETQIQVAGSELWQSLDTFPGFTATPPPVPASQFQSMPAIPIPSYAARKNNGFALTGFILALVSAPCFWFPPLSLLGVIFSTIGLMQVRHRPWQKGRGLAISGLVISLFSLLGAVAAYTVFGLANLGLPAPANFY